jgi:putative membrane protein
MFCSRFLGSGYSGGGGMLIMMIFGFLIFLVLIFLAFKMIKSNSALPFSPSNSSALNILNERYASGEIDEEEYTKRKIILTKKN